MLLLALGVLGFLASVAVAFLLEKRARLRHKAMMRAIGALNARHAVIARRLGPWIQRQPTEKAPAADTFTENEIPTKR